MKELRLVGGKGLPDVEDVADDLKLGSLERVLVIELFVVFLKTIDL